MPPLFAHDPLEALQRTGHPGWWLAPATAISVACEHWVLALVALALFAWLEGDVPAVLKAFIPLALALGVGVGIVLLCGRIGRVAGWGVRAVPSGHALWAATFAAYTLGVYGPRWGGAAGGLALAGGIARISLGSNGIPSVAFGWIVGVALGLATYVAAARLVPEGPAGRRRRGALTAPPKVA